MSAFSHKVKLKYHMIIRYLTCIFFETKKHQSITDVCFNRLIIICDMELISAAHPLRATFILLSAAF